MSNSIYMPVNCVWGQNAVKENSKFLSSLGKRCLILTGKNSAKSSGALDDAVCALEAENISYAVFDRIEENPLISVCREAGMRAREEKADFIFGIGGGSVLDGAKAVAIYAANPSLSPINIYKREYSTSPLPVALLGTTAGTGSEVTGVAVLTNDETGIKKSISGNDCYAKISFCDPKYTFSMPYKTTVSTALDAFAHATEGFFNQKCEGAVKMFAEKSISQLYRCLKSICESGKIDPSLREPLYYSSIYAGIVINTCGTAFPHPLGYILTENYKIPHGMACAAFFGPFADRCALFAPNRFSEFVSLTDEIETVKRVIANLTDTGGVHIGEKAEEFALRWQNAVPKNFTASPGGLTPKEAARILALI